MISVYSLCSVGVFVIFMQVVTMVLLAGRIARKAAVKSAKARKAKQT